MMDRFIVRQTNIIIQESSSDSDVNKEATVILKEKPSCSKNRKINRYYMEEYINYGFSLTDDKDCVYVDLNLLIVQSFLQS